MITNLYFSQEVEQLRKDPMDIPIVIGGEEIRTDNVKFQKIVSLSDSLLTFWKPQSKSLKILPKTIPER